VEEFMEINQAAIIHLELKYCERCGGLFLRRQALGEIYCGGCAEQMVHARPGRLSRRRPRLPVNSEGRHLQVVSRAEGGRV
jgi:hypothetical protein